jgi:hypothetical protein
MKTAFYTVALGAALLLTASTASVRAEDRGRVEAVHIEGYVGRAIPDNAAGLRNDALHARIIELIDVDHGLAGFVSEMLEFTGRIADSYVNGSFRIEYVVEHGVLERGAVMDCAVSNAIGRIDMGIDMHESDWRVRCDRLENRIGDGVVAACGYRHNSRLVPA